MGLYFCKSPKGTLLLFPAFLRSRAQFLTATSKEDGSGFPYVLSFPIC